MTYKVTVTPGFGSPDLLNPEDWVLMEIRAKTEKPDGAIDAPVPATASTYSP